MAKLGKSKVSKSALKVKAKAQEKAPKKVAKVAAPAVALDSKQPKKVSQKLIETIEKRKAAQQASPGPGKPGAKSGSMFGKPPARRGRRPKNSNVEYTPQNAEDEYSSVETEHESIEYDTGIRVKSSNEDRGFGLDRFEDFDEELNFDW